MLDNGCCLLVPQLLCCSADAFPLQSAILPCEDALQSWSVLCHGKADCKTGHLQQAAWLHSATEPHYQSVGCCIGAHHDACICRFAPFNQPPPPPPRARPPSAPIDHTGPRYMAGPPEYPPRPQQPQQMAGPGARGHGQYEGHGQMPSYGAGNMAGAGYMPPHLRNRERVSLRPCFMRSLPMVKTLQSWPIFLLHRLALEVHRGCVQVCEAVWR